MTKQEKYIVGIDDFQNDTIEWQYKIFYTEKEATKHILQTFYCDYFYLAKLDENNTIDLKTIKKIKTNNIKL